MMLYLRAQKDGLSSVWFIGVGVASALFISATAIGKSYVFKSKMDSDPIIKRSYVSIARCLSVIVEHRICALLLLAGASRVEDFIDDSHVSGYDSESWVIFR